MGFRQTSCRQFDCDDCRFAYRDSRFKQDGWYLTGGIAITSVVFRLAKAWQPTVAMPDVVITGCLATSPHQRRATSRLLSPPRQRKLPDPAVTPNAGSSSTTR